MPARRTHICVPILIALLCLGCLAVSVGVSTTGEQLPSPATSADAP